MSLPHKPSACLLLLAVFACSCVSLTSASRRASGADSQDDYRQYAEGREYAEEPDYAHHAAPGKRISRICLQRSSQESLPGGVAEIKFRCCTPADAPDACADNSSSPYPGYQHRHHRGDDRAFWDVVTQEPAATCRYKATNDACPPFPTPAAECFAIQVNCTLGPAAEECGLPVGHGGLVFSTKAYAHAVEALFCFSDPSTAVVPYKGLAQVVQGGINAIATREGYKEVKGSVEFINRTGADEPVQEPYPDLPWVKEGQQIIRLLDNTWDY